MMARDFNLTANHIKLDLFPATVVVDGVSLGEDLKAIVTDGHFYIFEDTLTGPDVTKQEVLVSFEGTNLTGYTVVTEQNTYHVSRSAGCACGSRLRGIHPFSGVPREA
jgi:hypothetical protein